MCMNCGCGQPDDDKGNDANITYSDLQRAAQANGMTVDETIDTIVRTQEQSDEGGSGTSTGSYQA